MRNTIKGHGNPNKVKKRTRMNAKRRGWLAQQEDIARLKDIAFNVYIKDLKHVTTND